MAKKREEVIGGEVVDTATGEVMGEAQPAPHALAVVEPQERAAYYGIATVPTTDAELAILLAPPLEADVDFRWADRDMTSALAYVSHIEYRRRLNRAFRPMGWGFRIVRSGIEGRTVVVHGALYIKGCFAAEAVGDHEYDETNANMSWGTAWESAKSESLTRCCKDLGMFSELWDKDYTEPLQAAWVLANRKNCPKCGKALRESKNGDGSWYCWAKMGGCGWQGVPEEKPQPVASVRGRGEAEGKTPSAKPAAPLPSASPAQQAAVAAMYGEAPTPKPEAPSTPVQTTRAKAQAAAGQQPTEFTARHFADIALELGKYVRADAAGKSGRQMALAMTGFLQAEDSKHVKYRYTEACFQSAIKSIEKEILRRKATGETADDDLPGPVAGKAPEDDSDLPF